MKHLAAFLITGLLITATPAPKTFTITLTGEQVDNLMQVIDESKDHQKVKAAYLAIWPQVQKQLSDSTSKKK